MTPALGCAVYFDHDLSVAPGPFIELVAAVMKDVPKADVKQTLIAESTQQLRKPTVFDAVRLVRTLEAGTAASASAEAYWKIDAEHRLVVAQTTPVAKLRPDLVPRHWKYDLVASLGPVALARLGPARMIDVLVEFADAVGVRAGIMHWASTTSFASGLAMLAGGGGLTQEEERRISDASYWRSRWGTIIRGPAWGTFLGPAHVETLGGIAAVRAGTGAERVVALRSGGAFVQLTSVDAPILEGESDPRLDRAAAFFRPVLGAPAA